MALTVGHDPDLLSRRQVDQSHRLRRDAARRPGVFGSPKDPEGCRAVLRRALELGVDHIDTSQYYGPHEVAFVPFFPLGSAFTGAPAKLAQDPVISAVAAKHGVLPTQVALAWLLAHYERMLLIPQQVGRPLG